VKSKKTIFNAILILLLGATTFFLLSNGNVGKPSLASEVPFYANSSLTPTWYNPSSSEKPPSSQFPEFSLLDQSGAKLGRRELEGKLVVANFFFTHCTNICPSLTSSMGRVRDAFKDRSDVMLLSHSVTPEFDIVPMLQAYANANNIDGKQWRLLTGSNSELSKVAHEGYLVPKNYG
jgi:protein SCO1